VPSGERTACLFTVLKQLTADPKKKWVRKIGGRNKNENKIKIARASKEHKQLGVFQEDMLSFDQQVQQAPSGERTTCLFTVLEQLAEDPKKMCQKNSNPLSETSG
jgi:hypothetical protein